MSQAGVRHCRYKRKEYQVKPEVKGQGILFGPSDIEQILLKRKAKPLSLQERQAIKELQAGGLIVDKGGV